MYRCVLQPVTLSDGTYLPTGTFIAIPVASLQFDPDIVPNPETFDPLRSYRTRQEPGKSQLHHFAMTDTTHMHFGHGSRSCPGRVFAANEIKMIVAALLLGYDMRYPEGKTRPRNITIDEHLFPARGANIMFRCRKVRDGVRGIQV